MDGKWTEVEVRGTIECTFDGKKSWVGLRIDGKCTVEEV